MLVLVEVIAVKLLVSLQWRGPVSTRRRAVGALLLGCVAGLVTSGAHGAESPAAPSGATAQPCSAAPAGALDVAALFGEFQCWLVRGQYAAALSALDQACGASDDPACLFNRGLVHHAQLQLADAAEAEHCAESRRNYAAYVDVSPYEAHAERARQALLELDQICGLVQVTPAPPIQVDPEAIPAWQGDVPPFSSSATPASEKVAPLVEPDEADAVSYRTTTWLLLGAGAASALAAVVAGVHTKRAYDDLNALNLSAAELQELGLTRRTAIMAPDTDETKSLERRLSRYEVMTWGFGATAAVLLGIGIGRTVFDSGPARSLAIDVGPGFGGLSYRGEL